MRFTIEQYDQAIADLQDGKKQLAPDGNCCTICTDSGHQAFECGRNPLVAMKMCEMVAKQSNELHDTLHLLSGYVMHMGEPTGPSVVKLPPTVEQAEQLRQLLERGPGVYEARVTIMPQGVTAAVAVNEEDLLQLLAACARLSHPALNELGQPLNWSRDDDIAFAANIFEKFKAFIPKEGL